MQNHYIYALLSFNVYNDAPKKLPTDWNEFKFDDSSLIPNSDFYAGCYNSTALKQIIIAFRGTQTLGNRVTEDIQIIFNKVPSLFTNNAVPYVEAVKAEAARRYPDFEISFTGHSLGAILAELCAAKYTKRAVTFESPGSGEMIVDLASKNQLPPDSPSNAAGNIISYQAATSVINRINPYLEKRFQIYPEIAYPKALIIPSITTDQLGDECGLQEKPTYADLFTYSLAQHRMIHLLLQFDPEVGALVYSEYPQSKDSGIEYAFNAWTNYDDNPHYWDTMIETNYYPSCGTDHTMQDYKNYYIAKWLIRNANPTQQTGVTIYAPGSSHYPALTIWGTTNGKNTIFFGTGQYEVIAYGSNTYKFERDGKISCVVKQMTLGRVVN